MLNWKQITMNPPTPDWSDNISSFLQRQSPSIFQEKCRLTRWKLIENEAGLGFASLMVTENGNSLVSTCTVTPKRLWRNGEVMPWAEIGDTFTDSEYQRKGMFGALVNSCRLSAEKAGFNLIYGLPNNQSLPGYVSKLDFNIKQDLVLKDYYAVISTKAIGLRTWANRVPLFKRILCAPILVTFSRKLTKLFYSLLSTKKSQVSIEKLNTFGSEFDSLWQNIRPTLANAQVRDSRYLNWRYCMNPFPFVIFAAKNGGELVGYVVTLTIHHDGEKGLSHTILIDWLYDLKMGNNIQKSLLFAAVNHATQEGVDVISALQCEDSPLPLPFNTYGFVSKMHDAPVIFHNNKIGRDVLADRTPWHFTLSDTDSF